MADGLTSLLEDGARLAQAFLDGLPRPARDAVELDSADEEERRRWFYTPTARRGVALGDLSPEQTQRFLRLLAATLSERGYNHAALTMGLERVLDHRYGFPSRLYGGTPGTRVRDPGNYRVAVFDRPGAWSWGWRVGGHHLSLHVTVRGNAVSVTPAFFGSEPARLALPGDALLRSMAAEEDRARDLLRSLDRDQRNAAVICPVAPTDIVQMNSPRVVDGALPTIGGEGPGGQVLRDHLELTPEHDEMYRYSTNPKGLRVADMSAEQQAGLRLLVETYFEHLAEPLRRGYDHVFDQGRFDETTFAWAGPREVGAPHYYRIQGERLLIEYDCAQNGANHTHSAWRDPRGDFGDALPDRG